MCMILRKRRKLTVDEQKAAFNCSERGMEGLCLLAKMYSIDPGYIRPSDSFTQRGVLTHYDSWSFNGGYNELEDYVVSNAGKMDSEWVVSDFIHWYEATGCMIHGVP